MTESTTPTSPEDSATPVRHALTRSRDDRVLAGVCGGVGRYLGVDPVLFRVLLPVLAVFGGSGIVLYALGWLLIPEEGAPESEAQRLLRGRGSVLTVLAVIALALGVFAFAVGDPGPPGGLLLAAIVVALVLYARRAPIDRARAGAVVYPPGNDPVGWPASGADDVTYPLPPPAPPEPRQRSPLGLATVSVALLASGLLLAADRAGVVTVGATTLLATALVVVGAGLVVGAWRGRARWLIAVGVALAIALLAALTTPRVPVAGGIGDRAFTPAVLADVRPTYRLGMGNSTVDLSRVAFAGARRDVAVSVGAGELTVVVPRTVTVTVHARVGLGELRVFGTTMEGNGLRRTVTVPAQGASQGRLELRAEVGMGQLEVRGATA